MASCVSSGEQNDLVVRTGMEFRLRRLGVEMLKDNILIYVIGSDQSNDYWMRKLHAVKGYHYFLQTGTRVVFNNKSILDIPKEYRSKAVVICFDEPSYSGRQSLYHIFGGEKLGLKTYQMFVDVMEKTQANGDAIVFTAEEIMWFPGPKPEFPAEDIYKFADIAFTLDVPLMGVYKLKDIPEPIQTWVLKTYPQTKYVNIQLVNGKDHVYDMWGWNEVPTHSSGSQKADWHQPIRGVKKAQVRATGKPEPAPEPRPQEEPDLKAQVTTLTDAIKTLTEVVGKLAAKV